MRVACVQIEPRGAQPRARFLDEVGAGMRAAPGADLYVLPELWSIGYFAFDRYADEAEPLDGPTVTAMAHVARSLDAHVHVGSVLERGDDGGLYNTSVLLSPDGEVKAAYRKMHVFGHQSRERELVSAGDEIVVADVLGTRVGLAICYDLRFPELFRRMVDQGAELFVVPATWPAARAEHWSLLLQARAVENLAVVIGCNATGTNGGVPIGGRSAVVGPWSDVLARAESSAGVLTADVDPDSIREARANFSALADRVLTT